ncbi:MAG: RsmB/NOP family class I SAM-dependent RNA methyltransferase [Rhodobacteraceae bacterium]|nr:RsmB/NOP family class I SAM-dependent RNA methyltransferase [Paracoccaceae bacterium]
MRPDARIAAAIAILDEILAGVPAEQAMTRWARSSRFAGSGDRAAIRDHVFSALRCRGSYTAFAGLQVPSGRALMLGYCLASGIAVDDRFTGETFAPDRLTPAERERMRPPETFAPAILAELDCPAWLLPELRRSLRDDLPASLLALRERAPVYLRVNAAKSSVSDAASLLSSEGIEVRPVAGAELALEILSNAGRLRNARAYREGHVELQDISPQAAVDTLDLVPGARVLDYCAGGGGKALALAARGVAKLTAHDIDPRRMADLPARAVRAGARIKICDRNALRAKTFDLVLLDVPCSGTGTWRRTPDAKWRLTPARLEELRRLQATILDRASAHVAPAGHLAYMTCSLLVEENRDRIDDFLARNPGWRLDGDRLFTPLSGGDGFYSALLTRGSGAA